MTTNFDTDPNTQTIAAAWASSPLGQPEREVRFGFAPTGPTEAVADEPRPDRKRAILAAALASGVIAGAGLGVMLFDYTESAQPTVVVPRSEGRLPAPPVAPPAETRPAPDNAPAPNPVVPQQQTGPAPVAPAPASGQGAADVGTPPVVTDSGPTVVIDIPIPDYPPLPEKPQDDPEPEPPQPPDAPDLDFKLPVPPEPEPDPDPPTFVPDLTLCRVSNFVANGDPLTRASVFVSPVWRMSPSHFRGESSIRPRIPVTGHIRSRRMRQ